MLNKIQLLKIALRLSAQFFLLNSTKPLRHFNFLPLLLLHLNTPKKTNCGDIKKPHRNKSVRL